MRTLEDGDVFGGFSTNQPILRWCRGTEAFHDWQVLIVVPEQRLNCNGDEDLPFHGNRAGCEMENVVAANASFRYRNTQ